MELVVFLIWISLSIAVAVLAGSKNRSAVGWFFLAALFSPLLMFILVAAMPALASSEKDQAEPIGNESPAGVADGAPSRETTSLTDAIEGIEKLGALKERGLLSDEEFASAKQRLLAAQPAPGAPAKIEPARMEPAVKVCVAALQAAGIRVFRAEPQGWELRYPAGITKTVTTEKELREVAATYQ